MKLSTKCTACGWEYGEHLIRDARCPGDNRFGDTFAPPMRAWAPLTPTQLSVRLRKKEYAAIAEAALRAGYSVATWVRSVVLRAADLERDRSLTVARALRCAASGCDGCANCTPPKRSSRDGRIARAVPRARR